MEHNVENPDDAPGTLDEECSASSFSRASCTSEEFLQVLLSLVKTMSNTQAVSPQGTSFSAIFFERFGALEFSEQEDFLFLQVGCTSSFKSCSSACVDVLLVLGCGPLLSTALLSLTISDSS